MQTSAKGVRQNINQLLRISSQLWILMGFTVSLMNSRGLHCKFDGFWWALPCFTVSLMGFDGFWRVLPWVWWVLTDFDGLYRVLPWVWWVLTDFDGFWWVLPWVWRVLTDFDGFYREFDEFSWVTLWVWWVLMGFVVSLMGYIGSLMGVWWVLPWVWLFSVTGEPERRFASSGSASVTVLAFSQFSRFGSLNVFCSTWWLLTWSVEPFSTVTTAGEMAETDLTNSRDVSDVSRDCVPPEDGV